MDYLLPKSLFSKKDHFKDPDDLLMKNRVEAQNARLQIQKDLNFDDDSVILILADSGIKPGEFNYSAADAKIKQRELERQKRKDDLNLRLKLKERQLFASEDKHDSDISIDAVMRKVQPETQFTLVPSPLPKTPPDNIRKWRDEFSSKNYELPSQEEERLVKEWANKSGRDIDTNKKINKGDHITEKIKSPGDHLTEKDNDKPIHDSISDDEFFSFNESPKAHELQKIIDQLRLENQSLTQLNAKLTRERNHWRHESNLLSLQKDELSDINNKLSQKIHLLQMENKKLFQYSSHLLDKSHTDTVTNRIEFDADDTTQLLKYATKPQSYKPKTLI